MEVGAAPVRLGDTAILVLPVACGSRGGRARRIEYCDIVSVALTRRDRLTRAAFSVAWAGGGTVTVPFSACQMDAMVALWSELWRRVEAARLDAPAAVVGSRRTDEVARCHGRT